MTSSQNLNKFFWLSSICFIALVTWSFTFELDKSVIAPGEIKPLGKPIIVQNRFEGKILNLNISQGQKVSKNEKLLAFQTEIDITELNSLKSSIETVKIKVVRLLAQTERKLVFEKQEDFDETIFAEQSELLLNEVQTLEKNLLTLENERGLKLAEKEAAEELIVSLEKEIQIAKAQLNLSNRLFKKGFEGKISLMEKESELIKKQNALTEHISSIGLLQKQIILIDSKIKAELGEFKKRTLKELVEAKEKLRELETKKQGASAKLREFFIHSPEAGIISKLNASYVGQFFKQGDNLLEIIPEDRPMVFYAKLPVQYIDELKLNQKALITLSTFDARTQKSMEGKVSSIPSDAISTENQEPYFEITLKFDERPSSQLSQTFVSGVTGQASILLGKRSVVEYFLEPIISSLRNAMTEA